MQKSSVKDQILSQLLDTYANRLGVLRKNKNLNKTDSSALFLPPDAPGSLGDEAMLAAAMKRLTNQGIKQIGIIGFKANADWENLALITDTVNMQGYFRSGSWKDRFRFVQAVSRYDRFYCVGADVMDGFYSERRTLRFINLVSLAAKTGADTTILGFSFNQQPTPASIQALTNLPASVRLCCRDPISHERLTHHLQRPVDLVADVAFLLQSAKDSDLAVRVSMWVRDQRSASRTVVGINANSLHMQSLPEFGGDELIRLYTNALVELFSKDQMLSFLMIPHDFRGQDSDVSLAEAILAALPSAMKPYCMQVPTPCSAAEIKSICADLDVVFTGRMHLAIACLGQGIPVAGVTYQGKFEGLFNHFELQGMTIAPEKAFQPGVLASFLATLIARRKDVSQQIQSKLAKVQALSSSNFERL
ncbi:MAG: polysaccharide pyruvyl transferase family protein [Gloeocapsa sp. UFS-A4-WI-NPMV-4B04]|jgi:polysaccharide pyruvyl transferase WcaK-like protein|nr:polysaccharide pyruvyl transferase family protein [Gloeocapsa sp. UFS-A4-WI-NPMV-4B04]